MSDDFEEHEGLIDDDPALDYILYKEMEKEDKPFQGSGNSGCLSLVLFMLIPAVSIYLLVDFMA